MKDIVPNNEALALKELGFDEPCFGFWNENKEFTSIEFDVYSGGNLFDLIKNHNNDVDTNAPTFSQVFRFFREKYSFCGWVQEHYFKGLVFYQYHISRETLLDVISDIYEAHEQAELECVKKLIEIAKQKN